MAMPTQPSFGSHEYVNRWLAEASKDETVDTKAPIKQAEAEQRENGHEDRHHRHPLHRHRRDHQNDPRSQSRNDKLFPNQHHHNVKIEQRTRGLFGPIDAQDHRFRKRPRSQGNSNPAMLAGPAIQTVEDPVSYSLRPTEPDQYDPSLKYARRPRHRTKVDKYEYKDHEEKEKPHRKRTQPNKRSSRKKSGAALNQDFKAPNVESERMTLKQNLTPGIFSKGKASAPVPKRGLPDLTFSEMTFLKKKRELDDARYRDLQDKMQPKKVRNSAVQDVSAYFATPIDYVSDTRKHSNTTSRGSMAESSPANLYGRPLGSDVSERRNTLETRSIQDCPETHVIPNRHANPTIPDLRQFQLSETAGRPIAAVHHSSSYVSWSQFPERQTPDSDRLGPELVHEETKKNTRHMATTVHPKSSVSNPIQSPRPKRRKHGSHDQVTRKYYTLKDLKQLAATIIHKDQTEEELQRRGVDEVTAFEPSRKSQSQTTSRVYQQANTGVRGRSQLSHAVHVSHEEQSWTESRPMCAIAAKEPVPQVIGPDCQEPEDGCEVSRFRKSPAPAHRGIGQGQLELLSSKIALSGSVVPPTAIPTHRLWQDFHIKPTVDGRHNHHDERFHFEQLELAMIPDLGQSCYDVIPRQISYHNQGIAPAEAEHPFPRDAYTLDAFDSALLESAELLNEEEHADAAAVEESDVEDHERLLAHIHDAEPNTEQYLAHTTAPSMRHKEVVDTGSSLGISLGVGEVDEGYRPQLLKPSEEIAISPEPFSGFSRPWILY